MPRFVLLLHECPNDLPRPTHCDLMLEAGDKLETWALAELPRDWRILPGIEDALQFAASNSVSAERLADHRRAYLEYEGPVSGNRGTVRQLDAGTYSAEKNPRAFVLTGKSIRGRIELQQTAGAGVWHLTFTPAPS